MRIADTLAEIFATRGLETFEGDRRVSQTSHGLQTAMLAEAEGGDASLIVAGLLHDIGRIVNPKDRALTDSGKDAKHEVVGQRYLEAWFGPEVTMPVKWHVAAKRYLVATDPAYAHKISPGSTRSLKGQGGLFTAEEAAAFLAQPFAAEGVQLRRWDDRAKLPDAETPPFAHFAPLIERCLKG
jgi:phosphonate degradation associated HDIG domain protein